ncbi:MAG: hypothetical protein HY057_04560, partial [Rhodospirillales bacterium]|nr:hypothetical protein [Rhodospirillales bacterium]
MQKLAFIVLVTLVGLFPLAANAQKAAKPPAPAVDTIMGMTTGQLTAITVGVIGGIVVANVALPTALGMGGTVIGAAAGALIANWWYTRQPDSAARGYIRQPTSISVEAPNDIRLAAYPSR